MPSTLFDESHGKLLCSQNVHDDREMDVWTRLCLELERLKFNVAPPHTDKTKPLTEVLAEHDVLVLGAPTVPQLSLSEVSAVRDFAEGVKSLLR